MLENISTVCDSKFASPEVTVQSIGHFHLNNLQIVNEQPHGTVATHCPLGGRSAEGNFKALLIQPETSVSPELFSYPLYVLRVFFIYLPHIKIVVTIYKCIHVDRPFVFSKTRNKIFYGVWYVIYHEQKRSVCVFPVLFYHLLGMILQPCRETK